MPPNADFTTCEVVWWYLCGATYFVSQTTLSCATAPFRPCVQAPPVMCVHSAQLQRSQKYAKASSQPELTMPKRCVNSVRRNTSCHCASWSHFRRLKVTCVPLWWRVRQTTQDGKHDNALLRDWCAHTLEVFRLDWRSQWNCCKTVRSPKPTRMVACLALVAESVVTIAKWIKVSGASWSPLSRHCSHQSFICLL